MQPRDGSDDTTMDGPSRTSFRALYTELRDRICLLDYPPGTVLSENKLAAEFGVSRTPIRRVLHALEFDGLVESKQALGTIVTALDLRELKQVYALRLKLIDLVAELPPGPVTDRDIALLDDLGTRVAALRDSDAQPRALGALYQAFHQELGRLTGNRPLREITDRFFHQTSRVWLQLLPEMTWATEVDAIEEEIGAIRDALVAKDLRRVSEVRRHHFQACLRRMNAVLAGQDLVDEVLRAADGTEVAPT
jgi:DNA-binding GntR family transcriptional regulator